MKLQFVTDTSSSTSSSSLADDAGVVEAWDEIWPFVEREKNIHIKKHYNNPFFRSSIGTR